MAGFLAKACAENLRRVGIFSPPTREKMLYMVGATDDYEEFSNIAPKIYCPEEPFVPSARLFFVCNLRTVLLEMKTPRPSPRVTRSVAAKNRNMANTFACHLAAFLEDKDMDKLAEERERFMGYLISRDFVRHTLQMFILRFLLFLLKHEYGQFYKSVVKDFLLGLQVLACRL